jgi:hypothetical protein
MALIDLLSRPVAYHRVFRAITGNTVAAIMLSQAFYWQRQTDNNKGGKKGWWYKSGSEWEDELGLGRSEQETARKVLVSLRVLRTERRGVPARMWYQVDLLVLEEKLQQYQQNAGFQQTRMRESSTQVCGDPADKFAAFPQTIIGTETTTKTTTPPPPSPSNHELTEVEEDLRLPSLQELAEAEVEEYIRLEADRVERAGEIRTTRENFARRLREKIMDKEGGKLTPERKYGLERLHKPPPLARSIPGIGLYPSNMNAQQTQQYLKNLCD